MTKVLSAKGETVDFDLLAIKSQMSESPKNEEVVARERFIDKKRRRGTRKIDTMLSEQSENKRYAENAINAHRAAAAVRANTDTIDDSEKAEVSSVEESLPKEQTVQKVSQRRLR